jgi:mannosidase alpha-like ER degradation enhancer 1
LPFAWVNLRHGVFRNESVFETNTAAAGSFTIEMGILSRLTGDSAFEHYARASLRALWALRTPLGLFGTALDMSQGHWLDSHGGIGASGDSFYEYLLKAHILFGAGQHPFTSCGQSWWLAAWHICISMQKDSGQHYDQGELPG